jgi:hypothetical protein
LGPIQGRQIILYIHVKNIVHNQGQPKTCERVGNHLFTNLFKQLIMKRSKAFLALTGAVLAIVGIASAKAHRSTAVGGFYTSTRGFCTKASNTQGYTHNLVANTLVTVVSGRGTFKVWTKSGDAACSAVSNNHKLYTSTTE